MGILRKSRFLLLSFVMAGTFGLVSVASASVVNIGGVSLPLGSQTFSGNLFEGVVANPGDTLSGYGQITSLGSNTNFCTGGFGTCSLTYTFDNYTLASIDGSGNAVFTGGEVKIYVQGTSAPIVTSVNSTNASSGTLWLDLVAAQNAAGDTLTGSLAGNGFPTGGGFLSVTGSALANNVFDTNAYTGAGSPLGTLVSPADIAFTTSISGANGPTPFSLSGSSTGSYLAVPEPSDLGMMGFGLLMVGLMGLRFRQSRFRRD